MRACLIVRCDVRSWDDQVNLFSEALNNFGAISVVIANAGVTESPELGKIVFNAAGKPMCPDILTTEVNLMVSYIVGCLPLHPSYSN
jgi:NAD(P)-dependent dehydrogenase (short-subunit alcohol dehydrogenase family)